MQGHERPRHVSFNQHSSNPLTCRIAAIVEALQMRGSFQQDLKVVWADLSSSWSYEYIRFTTRLVEDSVFGAQSYVDFLCKLHTKIKMMPK